MKKLEVKMQKMLSFVLGLDIVGHCSGRSPDRASRGSVKLIVSGLLFLGLLASCGTAPTEESPAATGAEPAADANGLVGVYNVDGTNPDASAYRGRLEITQAGEIYKLGWTIAFVDFTGSAIYENDVLSVGWGHETCTVVSYQLNEDGSLDGKWFLVGQEGFGTEHIEPLADGSANNLVGRHTATGTRPDGTEYTSTVDITIEGSVYTFIWDNLELGTGIQHGDVISVGWGGDICSVAAYTVQPNGTLDGEWTNVGKDQLGTEIAQPVEN